MNSFFLFIGTSYVGMSPTPASSPNEGSSGLNQITLEDAIIVLRAQTKGMKPDRLRTVEKYKYEQVFSPGDLQNDAYHSDINDKAFTRLSRS